jgi:hypothetical protein
MKKIVPKVLSLKYLDFKITSRIPAHLKAMAKQSPANTFSLD